MRDFNLNDSIPPLGDVDANFVPYALTLTQNVTAGAISNPFRDSVGARAFLARAIGIESTEEFEISLRDVGAGEEWFSERTNTRTIISVDGDPFFLPIPWLFGAGSEVEAVANNLGGSDDDIRITLFGHAIPSNLINRVSQRILSRRYLPYFLMVDKDTVNAGVVGRTTPTTRVGPRDFYWTHTGVHAENVEFSVFIRDINSNSAFMRDRIHRDTLVGTRGMAKFGGWRFAAQSSVEAELENLDAVTDERINLTLAGYIDRESEIL